MIADENKRRFMACVVESRDPREYLDYLRWLADTENATVLRDGLPISDMTCTNRETGEVVVWLSTGEVRSG